MANGLKSKKNFKFFVKTLDGLDKELIKCIYKDDGCIFIDNYLDKDKNYEIEISNFNALTGIEFNKKFNISKTNVRGIEEIV